MYIYKTTCLVNNKIHIGQCCRTPKNSVKYLGSGKSLKYAIEKYGKENFEKEILKQNIKTQRALDVLETFYIKKFNACNKKIGYNMLEGPATIDGKLPKESKKSKKLKRKKYTGEGNPFYGKKHTDEAKKIISDKAKIRSAGDKNPMFGRTKELAPMFGKTGDKHPMFGKHHTEESKQKISETSTGRKLTEEHKRKIGEAQKGKPGKKGYKHTEEAKRNMSKAQKGRTISEESRKKLSDSKKGKKLSEDHKRKLSEGQRRRYNKIE